MKRKNSQGQQSQEYILWKEAQKEFSICIDILKAVEGQKSHKSVRNEHLDSLADNWKNIKSEVQKIEENPQNTRNIIQFLEKDSQKLEKTVAHIIGAYIIAEEAFEEMKSAKKNAPSHIAKRFNIKREEKKLNKIRVNAIRKLESIENGIKNLDRELKKEYSKNKDSEMLKEIRFIEDISQSIEHFVEKGNLEPPLRKDVLKFVKTNIDEIKSKENTAKDKSLNSGLSKRGSSSFL